MRFSLLYVPRGELVVDPSSIGQISTSHSFIHSFIHSCNQPALVAVLSGRYRHVPSYSLPSKSEGNLWLETDRESVNSYIIGSHPP